MMIRKECSRMFKTINDKLDKITDNELPHIQEKITVLKTDMAWVKKGVTGILFLVGAVLVSMISYVMYIK